MYSRRDAHGEINKLKTFRAHEPAPAKMESIFTTPREKNIRFTSSTPHTTNREANYAPNPVKLTSKNRAPRNGPRIRRQLPQVPTSSQNEAVIYTTKQIFYSKKDPLASETTTKSTFQEIDDGLRTHYTHSDKTIQPLATSLPSRSFRHETSTGEKQWNQDHGFSERDAIGKMPEFRIGSDKDQVKEYHKSQDFIQSLRMRDDDKSWWRPQSKRGSSVSEMDGVDEDLPPVFQRLTDASRYNSTHKHRFSKDGIGLGLEGRRDDEYQQLIIAGKAKIMRDLDDEMDAPNKPKLPWPETAFDSPTRSSSRATSQRTSRARNLSTDSPNTSALEQDLPPVFQRLTAPKKKSADGDYEIKRKVMEDYGCTPETIPRWQSGL